MEGQTVGGSQRFHEYCVFVGGFADTVMNVHHRKCDSEAGPLLEEAPKERNGVCSTGDRNSDPLAWAEKVIPQSEWGRGHG
jgi:hypothetical protein